MGFLREASKNYHYEYSEGDVTAVIIILGLILLSLFIYLIWDYIKNGPNTFGFNVPHPLVDYTYPGWKHLAEQPGEVGEKIRSIRREYYGINYTYIKTTDNEESNNNETKI